MSEPYPGGGPQDRDDLEPLPVADDGIDDDGESDEPDEAFEGGDEDA